MPSVTEAIKVLLVLIQVHYAKSEVRVQPRDTEAVVGQLTYVNCSTSLPSRGILWYHYPVGASESNYIYLMGQLQPPYTERYRVDTQSETGEFNLVIQSVETRDAGKYVCQEEGEHGQYGIAELIVLDSNPVCESNMKEDGIIGTNNCDVKPEEIQLSCTVSFHGNIPPMVEWSEVGKDGMIGEGIHQEISVSNVTSFLHISGHHSRHGSSFACQTRRSTTKQNRCISDGVKVIYGVQNLTIAPESRTYKPGDRIECWADGNPSPTYEWTELGTDNITKGPTLTVDDTLQQNQRFIYQCTASNVVAGQRTSTSKRVVVNVAYENQTGSAHVVATILPTVLLIGLSIIGAVIIATSILGFCIYKLFHTNKQRNKQEKSLEPGDCYEEIEDIAADVLTKDIPIETFPLDMKTVEDNATTELEDQSRYYNLSGDRSLPVPPVYLALENLESFAE